MANIAQSNIFCQMDDIKALDELKNKRFNVFYIKYDYDKCNKYGCKNRNYIKFVNAIKKILDIQYERTPDFYTVGC